MADIVEFYDKVGRRIQEGDWLVCAQRYGSSSARLEYALVTGFKGLRVELVRVSEFGKSWEDWTLHEKCWTTHPNRTMVIPEEEQPDELTFLFARWLKANAQAEPDSSETE